MKTPLKVVSLADYRKKTTAEQLISEVSLARTGPSADMFEIINMLPEIFEQSLCLILADFDYETNKDSKIGEACRLLASSHDYFEHKFQEVRA